ncbi:MAG: hypothetical protein WCL11_19860 [Verrucomicrobiota bacterium]|nr:hypothetical protein [Verrucomicrobiota bacterium]
MTPRIRSTALLLGWALAAAIYSGSGLRLQAATLKLQAQLVWGTNDERSPDPKHKPVEAVVKEKLKELPLKWSNYFEINRKNVELSPSGTSKVELSEKCQLEVTSLGGSKLEVILLGKGKETLKRTQALPKGEMLVLGGNAPNATAWLVVLKRIE